MEALKEGLEAAPEAQQFKIVGVDRLQMPEGMVTVVRGEVDGQPKALLFDAAHPPEFTLPTEPASESDGLFSKLRRSTFGRVAFALGGAMAAALAACAPPSGNSQGDGGISKGGYGTHQAALTEADADNLGPPTPIPWSTFGDQHPNIAEIGGQKVFTFTRADGRVWYVDCADFENCLSAGVPVEVVGLPVSGGIRRSAIYQNGAGADKFATTLFGTVLDLDIGYNGGGVLEASNPAVMAPGMAADHIGHMKIGGDSHLTWDSGSVADRNMATGIDTGTGIPGSPDANYCGVPHQDDAGIAIGSDYIDLGGGVYRCHLIQAPTLADLAASVNYLNSQNVTGPPAVIHDRLVNPRVFENYLIYARYDENPPGSGIWQPRMYYAVVQEYCGNGACAGGETPGSCPADCVPPPAEVCDDGIDNDGDGATDCDDPECAGEPACVPPDDDAGPGDDDAGPGDDDAGPGDDDAGPGDDDGGPGDDDGGPGDDDSGPGDDDAGPGDDDAGPGDDDAGPGDDDSGTPPTETCNDGIDNDGDGATDCADPECEADPACVPPIDACDFAEARIVITEGECNLDECEDPFVDVVGACTFEVDLGNENPVTIEIDGRYGLDLLDNFGELLHGSYKVVDRGNGMDTVTGNLVTGVEGTIYGGDLNQAGDTYHVYCEEGRITISYNGEVIATLEAGEEGTFDLEDPIPDDDDTTDGGDDDTPDGGDDDVSDGGDTPPPPKTGCSCDIKGGAESNAATAGMLLLMAVGLMRRKIKNPKIR